MVVLLVAFLSSSIGVVLGMLGGGGAILMLPMLVYVAHVEPKAAIAASLFVVGSTSATSMVAHARAGNVRWKVGGLFGSGAMAGAFAGGRAAHFFSGAALLVVFGVLMLAAGIAMMRRRGASSSPGPIALGRAVVLGMVVGVLSGLVGAGGGFLIVPALALLGGLAMREAVATSLFVITLQSFAGFAGHATHVDVDWSLVLVTTAAAIVGSLVGVRLSRRVSPDGLRRAFAHLVIAMGLFVVAKQAVLPVTLVAAALTAIGVYLVTRNSSSKKGSCTSSPPSPR